MVDLASTAHQLLQAGKGLLAADESVESADEKRLKPYGITPSVEMRRAFRDLLLSAPGVEAYLSGVILHEETLSQKGNDKVLFPKSLAERGILPGIKVDQGLEPMPDSPDESITRGLLGLPERLAELKKKHGTEFTKWRAAIKIDGTRLPTSRALVENGKRLAQYAYDVQLAGMVPIVEPEVLLEGAHSRIRAKEVLTNTLEALFGALQDQAVDLSGLILKTSMVLSGSKSGRTDTSDEVAADTLEVLLAHVPPQLAGIVFLSGGQTPDQATENLRAISALAHEKGTPWPLTYSYARAFQEEALAIWKGEPENVEKAREAYLSRLKACSEALKG